MTTYDSIRLRDNEILAVGPKSTVVDVVAKLENVVEAENSFELENKCDSVNSFDEENVFVSVNSIDLEK